MRDFLYCRVSTVDQLNENQIVAAKAAGYEFPDSRIVEEEISGSVEAMKRKKFKRLVEDQMESGDRLIVTKLDRLGRDNIDVQKTIDMLLANGIDVVCLDLPVPDLGSSAGKLMRGLMGNFAQFERDRIIERTQEGLARARAQGKTLGRPFGSKNEQAVADCRKNGLNKSETARHLGLSLSTVKRLWGG